jgi:hypothetical protein
LVAKRKPIDDHGRRTKETGIGDGCLLTIFFSALTLGHKAQSEGRTKLEQKLSAGRGLRLLARDQNMNNWLHNLPVVWMALVIFGVTYLVAAATYAVVAVLAVGERARSFKAVSPAMLPPLCIIFGLFVAFTLRRCGAITSGPTRRLTAKPAR